MTACCCMVPMSLRRRQTWLVTRLGTREGVGRWCVWAQVSMSWWSRVTGTSTIASVSSGLGMSVRLRQGLVFLTSDIIRSSWDTFIRFEAFKSVVPPFLTVRPELCCAGSLQKLSDCIREHQDWGLVHMAVSLDMVDLVGDDRFKVEIDMADNAGMTPLMLAVSLGSRHLVVGLLNQGASLQGTNVVGDNVFHAAAAVPLSILDILTGSEQAKVVEVMVSLMNQCNKEGNTPLHLACQADKPEIVKAMLCAGSD